MHVDSSMDIDIPADAVAVIADDGSRVPLSGPDEEGYQTPERGDFTAVGLVVRLDDGSLATVDLPRYESLPVPEGVRFQGLTPLRATFR